MSIDFIHNASVTKSYERYANEPSTLGLLAVSAQDICSEIIQRPYTACKDSIMGVVTLVLAPFSNSPKSATVEAFQRIHNSLGNALTVYAVYPYLSQTRLINTFLIAIGVHALANQLEVSLYSRSIRPIDQSYGSTLPSSGLIVKIMDLQDAIYRKLRAYSEDHSILGRVVAIPAAVADVFLDTVRRPLFPIANAAMTILNVIGTPFSKEYSLKKAVVHSFMTIDSASNCAVHFAETPFKLIYQLFASIISPTATYSINTYY